MASEHHILDLVAEQLVVDISRNGAVVYGKFLECCLHPIEARGLPDEIDDVVAVAVHGHARVALQLDSDLVAKVIRDFDNVTHTGPRFLQLSQIPYSQFISVH